jgi:hypothetical protein
MGAMDVVFQSECLLMLILSVDLCTDTPCDNSTIANLVMVCRLFREVIAKLPVSRIVDCCTPEMVTGIAKCTQGVARLVILESELLQDEFPFSKVNDKILKMLADYLPCLTHLKFSIGMYNHFNYSVFVGSCITSNAVCYMAERLTNLREIRLPECRDLCAEGIARLVKSCTKLEILDVSAEHIYPYADDFIDDEEFVIPPDKFTDVTLGIIGSCCKSLRELGLNNRLNVTNLNGLVECTLLEKLSVELCEHLVIGPEIQSFGNLTTLNLFGTNNLNTNIGYIVKLLHLESINIGHTDVNDDGIQVLITGIGQQLTLLDVCHCNITLRGYIIIAMFCKELRDLNVKRYLFYDQNNYNLVKNSLDYLTIGCTKLEHIILCKIIDSEMVKYLERLTQLKTLNILEREEEHEKILVENLRRNLRNVEIVFW